MQWKWVSASMSDEIISKLVNFGFTVNQAKVYLSIVQMGRTRVGRVSKNTKLHRQDIYKLLPKLEKMGMIARTIDKPFMIEAIPIEKALENIIAKEKEAANEKIALLENNLKDVVSAIQEQPRLREEARFTLLTTDESIRNKGKIVFKKPRKEFHIVSTLDHITRPGPHYFRDLLYAIAQSKAKLRLVIISSDGIESIKQTVDKVALNHLQLHIKHIPRSTCKNFQIIDNKEVWLATQQKTELGYPCILWTNDSNIVDAYRENFKKIWNDVKAQTIHHNIVQKDFDLQKSEVKQMHSSVFF